MSVHARVTTETKEESREGAIPYTIKVEYPCLVGAETVWQEEINLVLGGFAMGLMQSSRKDFLAMLDDEETAKHVPEGSRNGLWLTYELSLFDDNLLSLAFTVSTYAAGAAHPNSHSVTRTFQLDPTVKLQLQDLFKSEADHLERLSQRVITDLTWQAEQDGFTQNHDWIRAGAAPSTDTLSKFELTPSALVILFDPYQVGPYAWGTRRVDIPFIGILDDLDEHGPLRQILANLKLDTINVTVLEDFQDSTLPRDHPRRSEYSLTVPRGTSYGGLLSIIQTKRHMPTFIVVYGNKLEPVDYIFIRPSQFETFRMADTHQAFSTMYWAEEAQSFIFENDFNKIITEDIELVLTPNLERGGGGGGFEAIISDPWNILATVISIARLLVAVADYRLKRQPKSDRPTVQQILEITVLMHDGSRIRVTDWSPSRLIEFVNAFSRPEASNKPHRAIFTLTDGTQYTLYVSTETDRENLERFMFYLNLDTRTDNA